MEIIEKVWDYLIESNIATNEELQLITQINGYNIESLNEVIYARCGFEDYTQLMDEDDEEGN